jgi:hypothetical protein
MKWHILFLATVLINLSGCLKTKTSRQSSYGLSNTDKAEVQGICEAMEAHGDIWALLRKIKRDTNQVLEILESPEAETQVSEISKLAEGISEASVKVQELAKAEWTEQKYEHGVRWDIDAYDFKDLIGTKVGGFVIRDFQLNDVYFLGKKRPDLKMQIQVSKDYDGIHVKYESKTSALDLCQLEKTLMVVIEVRYKNVFAQGTRYFNLIVKR